MCRERARVSRFKGPEVVVFSGHFHPISQPPPVTPYLTIHRRFLRKRHAPLLHFPQRNHYIVTIYHYPLLYYTTDVIYTHIYDIYLGASAHDGVLHKFYTTCNLSCQYLGRYLNLSAFVIRVKI